MKKTISLLTIIVFTMIFVSCQKQNFEKQTTTWKAKITKSEHQNFTELYKSVPKVDLKKILDENDEVRARKIIEPLADQVASLINTKHGLNIADEFENNPQGLVVYGLFYLYQERTAGNVNIGSQGRISEASLSCLITAVGSVVGISDVKALWKSFVAGATEATALAAAKVLFKRVAICVTSVFALYELGSCLNLW